MEWRELKALRAERGLTQRQLSAKSGVAQDAISKLERGEREPQMRTVRKLANALAVKPYVLLYGSEEVFKSAN